jgi:hypothetical protein
LVFEILPSVLYLLADVSKRLVRSIFWVAVIRETTGTLLRVNILEEKNVGGKCEHFDPDDGIDNVF